MVLVKKYAVLKYTNACTRGYKPVTGTAPEVNHRILSPFLSGMSQVFLCNPLKNALSFVARSILF